MPRFYYADLTPSKSLQVLPSTIHRHAIQVLRLKQSDMIRLFDGRGVEYEATLTSVGKRESTVQLGNLLASEKMSPLSITLIQGISKGDRMDIAIQKAVELGVNKIMPVLTERCNVQLKAERSDKKWAHWHGVMVSSCEQSGRNILPELAPIMPLQQAIAECQKGWILSPTAKTSLSTLPPQDTMNIAIGPEGGFSDEEIHDAEQNGFQSLRFGPRILRTETAAIAVISAAQAMWGDLA